MNLNLQPQVLRWARERAGLDESALAKKLGINAERLTEWETNGELPFAKAELLAKKTHTPFGYLFLKEPPEDNLPIPDLRTVGDAPLLRPSPDLLETVLLMQRRQAWLREFLGEEGEPTLDWVGSAVCPRQHGPGSARNATNLGANGGLGGPSRNLDGSSGASTRENRRNRRVDCY